MTNDATEPGGRTLGDLSPGELTEILEKAGWPSGSEHLIIGFALDVPATVEDVQNLGASAEQEDQLSQSSGS